MVAEAQIRLAAVLIAAAACGSRPAPGIAALPPSHQVADLVLPSVDGAEVELRRFRGKPVVVHFASTGSLDAQADVEKLRRLREGRPGLALVEIVLDDLGARVAGPWADASRIDWAVLLPTPELIAGDSAFGPVRVVPTTFLLDEGGRVSWRWEGALRRGVIEAAVAALPPAS